MHHPMELLCTIFARPYFFHTQGLGPRLTLALYFAAAYSYRYQWVSEV